MIADLNPYPEMKDSGVSWLAAVPKDWAIVRSKRIFTPRTELARPDDVQLSATQAYGVIPQADYERAVRRKIVRILQHLEKRRHVEVDDFVISMRSFQGGLERAWASGCIRSSYVVLRAATDLNVAYFGYLFKSNNYIGALQSTANFIRDGQDLNFDNFCAVDLPFPPLDEQAAIVRFLDHADRRIRRCIRAKQKLVSLLEEQKYAIIHRVVTRGLDPHARLKPSGVEWLGDIPEHWSLKRFKFLARVASGQVDPRQAEHRDKILIAPNHIKSGTGRLTHLETAAAQGADSGKYEVRQGQIIYSKIRPNLRKAAIAPLDCLCSADMYPIAVRETELRSSYLLLLLLSAPFTKYAVDCSLRVAMPKVNREALGECWLWYPRLEEQDAILEFVKHTTNPTDVAVAQAEGEIALLREYRTRLIADVVTGKLDVREAAARLPEGVDERESPDEVEATDTGESADDLEMAPEEVEA